MRKFVSVGICMIFLMLSISISGADLTGKRVYVDPGHGSWTSNDRPCATISHPLLSTGLPDTLGFYESNTNLWKCLYLGEKLEESGATVFYSRKANGPNKALSTRAAEVEANNIDYFISVHSNATSSQYANYPLYLYRGPKDYKNANTANNYEYVPGSYEKAETSWDYCNEIMLSGVSSSSDYKTGKYIAGDKEFYNDSYETTNSHSGKKYYGHLGVLMHGASGFLVEGYFHTYEPARHRALNPDYCTMEGLAYYRGIVDYYDADTEANGYIMGAIRTKSATMNNSLYTYISKSNDQYQPINGAKVVLRNSKGTLIYCNCYPYVARELKNQPYYTTDDNWNGIFTYKDLAPDTYYISVHKEGYADYYGTVEVTANETSYLNIFIEPGTSTEPNITDVIEMHQPSYLELPDVFEMQQSYINQPIDEVLKGKTIRRALYDDGIMYVLAVDNAGEPTLLEVDTETHRVINTLPTNHCSVTSANGLKLSDIALTIDGVLVGCNMEAVTFTPSNKWKLYKWQKTNSGSWTGSLWLSHANNETAGNYNNALVGGTFAYEGLSHSGTIVTIARNTGSNNNIRFVIYQIDGNNVKTVIRNHPSDVSVNTYGDKIQMNKSPLGDGRFIFTSSTYNGFEWQVSNTTASVPIVHTENIAHSYGANYFVYANHTLMVTPSMANGQNTGVVVYDITKGWNNITLVRTTNTTLDATNAIYAMAAAQVDSLDITLYLLQDYSLSKFTTIGVEQPIIPHINAYNLRAKQNKQSFTFTFTANSEAESAALVFYDKSSCTELGRKDISVSKGHNEVIIQMNELPGTQGQEITWAIDLSGLAISNWGKINVPTNNFTRPFVAINNNPQSEHFQYLYISERAGSAVNGNGLYVFTPDYTRVNDSPYKGGRNVVGSPYSCNVDDQGYIWLSDGSDSYSGIFIVDPENPSGTHQEFFQGTRNNAGLITNNSQGIGSSITGLSFYGTGKNTKLLTINEDAGSGLANNSLSIYNIGTAEGIYNHTWSTAPTKNIDLPDVGTYYAYPLGCSHGVWVTVRRSAGQNTTGYAALQFFDWEGNRKMCSLDEPYASLINGSLSAACIMSKDESVLYFVDGSGNIMVWDIEWTLDHTPNMTLRYSYPTGLTDIREMQLDYAGNLICSGDDEDITVFTIPTSDNHTLVPASNSQSICKNYIAPQSITLSHSSIELIVGNTTTLTATLLPANASNNNILWSSADATTASVNENGLVTALKKGITTIYATAEDNHAIIASCEVTVSEIIPQSISLNETALELELTHTHTLTATIQPANATNPNVLWSSADATIASVDENGLVTAHNRGTTTIYATAEANNTIVDSCTINIFAYMSNENACRIWAYDLTLTSTNNSHTFTFKSTTYATTAYLLFLNKDEEEIGRHALNNVKQGENSFTLSNNEIITDESTIYWAIELHSDRIANITEITADAADKYFFYLPQGVAINNNPNSKHFGKIYVAEPYAGANDGKSTHSKTQTKGIYVFDPLLNIENYAKGYLPSNVTMNNADGFKQLHRIAINPLTDDVVFVQSTGALVWSIGADDLSLNNTAVNLIETISEIQLVQSHCFDDEGNLYVLYAHTDNNGGELYKVSNGVAELMAQSKHWANERNSIASDGHGGIWLTQYREQLDTYDILSHINKNGEIDLSVNIQSANDIKAIMPTQTRRGQLAYNTKEDILALGGNGYVYLYKVTYDKDMKPSLSQIGKTPTTLGSNIDGIAFDYAGDLVALSASVERFYKFALPTENNMCITPAPQAKSTITEHTLDVSVNDNVKGSVDVTSGTYEHGEQVTLTATPAENCTFVSWTVNGEVYMENPLTITMNEDITIIAYFENNSIATSIANLNTEVNTEKLFYNGQVLIIRNGKVYTIQGTLVKD